MSPSAKRSPTAIRKYNIKLSKRQEKLFLRLLRFLEKGRIQAKLSLPLKWAVQRSQYLRLKNAIYFSKDCLKFRHSKIWIRGFGPLDIPEKVDFSQIKSLILIRGNPSFKAGFKMYKKLEDIQKNEQPKLRKSRLLDRYAQVFFRVTKRRPPLRFAKDSKILKEVLEFLGGDEDKLFYYEECFLKSSFPLTKSTENFYEFVKKCIEVGVNLSLEIVDLANRLELRSYAGLKKVEDLKNLPQFKSLLRSYEKRKNYLNFDFAKEFLFNCSSKNHLEKLLYRMCKFEGKENSLRALALCGCGVCYQKYLDAEERQSLLLALELAEDKFKLNEKEKIALRVLYESERSDITKEKAREVLKARLDLREVEDYVEGEKRRVLEELVQYRKEKM